MTKLCPRGKAAAKRKFKVYPSAYANAYASKICAGKIKDPSGVKRKDFKGPKPAGKKVGGMTAGAQSALGRIQKANMMKRKGGLQHPVIDSVRPTKGKSKSIKALAKRKGLPAPLMSNPKFKFKDAGKFPAIKTAPSQSDVSSKAKRLGKFIPRRLKLVGALLGAAAAGAAGKKALDKRKKKVDKKRMGGLKSELNNPARGYTKGGIARGGGAAIKGTDFKGVF